MDSETNVFLSVLKRKLIGIDPNVSFIHHQIQEEIWEREELYGGESLTIRMRCLLINKSMVNWIIERLQEFGFSFELFLYTFLLFFIKSDFK